MAGGGTGGHVVPLLAVAEEVRNRGHEALFIGTLTGLEARLVPAAGFPVEWIEIGPLKAVGAARRLRTLAQLPLSMLRCWRLLARRRAAAVFSLGGYAAGPVVLAAIARRLPLVLMEPNAAAGFTNRRIGRFAARALINFEETAAFFPPGKTERTGLPVREEFFRIPPKPPGGIFTVLVTGGSQGSRTLNRAARAAWPLAAASGLRIRWLHQSGRAGHEELAQAFAALALEGRVLPFIEDMPAAFAEADLVVSRAGAAIVAELAAAGKPSVLVPFPYAADQHQLHNAEAMARAGAARLVADGDLDGPRLFAEAAGLARAPALLRRMGAAARTMARPDAARRAAALLEELGRRPGDLS